MVRAIVRLLLALVIIVVAAGLVVAGVVYYQGHCGYPADATYTALGSSFAAGPGLGERVGGSLLPCLRSQANYPHLVAAAEHLVIADATCSGATTRDVLLGGQFLQPPQIDAVTAGTRLVTVTVGGNDVFYLGDLSAWACANDPDALPAAARALVCGPPHDRATVAAALDGVEAEIAEVITEAQRRAPSARVLVVNYLTILPDAGVCDRLPLTPEEADAGRAVAARLLAATAAAVSATGAELVDVATASHGHDLCSTDPWVQGFVYGSPFANDAAAFHPNREGVSAVAALIVDKLRQ